MSSLEGWYLYRRGETKHTFILIYSNINYEYSIFTLLSIAIGIVINLRIAIASDTYTSS